MPNLIAYLVSFLLGALGLVFVVGAQGLVGRIVVGAILLVAAVAVAFIPRMRPQTVEVKQSLDLTGDVSLESMACKACGAALDRSDVQVKAGAVFVNCSHCSTSYQLEEQAKW